MPRTSGIVAPDDMKALVALDLNDDGWPDLLASANNATTRAWVNRGGAGRHSIQVRLQGAPGNAGAVGALIRLELADGTVQLAEITAGGGYYSQTTAAAFFAWPDSNPPTRLVVRWPDGTMTEQKLLAPLPHALRVMRP